MTFKEASDYTILFGEYKDQTIGKIAEADKGLLYLDWLRGETWLHNDTEEAINIYLDDESIAQDLQKAMEEKK